MNDLTKFLRSRLTMQFLLVGFVYALVIGGSYPVILEAQRDEAQNHYPDKLSIEDNLAQRRFTQAKAHPENVDEYLAAGDAMASVLIRQQKFEEATDIYQKQMGATWNLVKNAYNPRWIDANLKLAAVHRDMGMMKPALICYQAVLDQDMKYLAADDSKIARDLNNIGLMHYLLGLGQEEDKDRFPEFQLAIDNYKKALEILSKHPQNRTDIAANLWNLYLAERDIGDKARAEDYRKQAMDIDKSMPRVCRAP